MTGPSQTTFQSIDVADRRVRQHVTWCSRLVTTIPSVDPVAADLEIGLAIIGTLAGITLGLLALVLGAWWRITTPLPSSQPTTGSTEVISSCR